MRALAAFFVAVPVVVLLCAERAEAYTHTGNTYTLVTGEFCIGCHSSSQVPAPDITITQVTPDPLTVGGSAVFEIKLHSNAADPSTRFAGFAAGAKAAAGTFKANTDDPAHTTELCGGAASVTSCPSGFTATRDISLRPWEADGTYTWQIELDQLGAGNFNLFVGGNDANGDGTIAGDHNNHAKLAFTVPGAGEGEGSAGEGEGAAAGEGEGAGGGEGEGATPPSGCNAVQTGTAVPFGGLACVLVAGAIAGVSRRRPAARR